MIKKRRKQLMRLYLYFDALAVSLGFLLVYWFRFHSGFIAAPKGIPPFNDYLLVLFFLLISTLIGFSYQGFYKIRLRRNRLDDLFLILVNTIVVGILMLLVFSYLKSYGFIAFEVSHFFVFYQVPILTLLVFVERLAVFSVYKRISMKDNGISHILVVGDGDLATMTARNLSHYAHFGIEVCGYLSPNPGPETLGGYDELDEIIDRHHITDLFIALPLTEYQTIMKLIDTGNRRYLDIRLVPDLLQMASLKAGMEHIEGIPIINLGDIPMEGVKYVLKRLVDISVSLLGLIALSPFLLFIALAVKLSSRGPILYTHTRVGLDGKHFRMIKFRTMIRDAEKTTGAIWSPQNDPRVTPIGRLLRKTSIDELPQLLNVLKGDMSLVGPRPERPELVARFQDSIPNYMLRHRVKTGMTGWAQVHGLRGNTPLDKRIEFDIYYIQNWTLRLDLQILWRTILKFQFIDHTND
jgi:exopolysaccharide biosynthesis polyprenyl glycosylphosphotransferase